MYRGDYIGLDIATDAQILINKTLNKLDTPIDRNDSVYDTMLDTSTVYIDILRSTHPINTHEIEKCPLETFLHNCVMTAMYAGGFDPEWSVHDKFLSLRRLNILPGGSELTSRGRQNRIGKA